MFVVGATLLACADGGAKSRLRQTYISALDASKNFAYRKSAGANADNLETRIYPRPDDFVDEFPADESYFYDAAHHRGCFAIQRRGDTLTAVVKSGCAAHTPLVTQNVVEKNGMLKYISFDVRKNNEIYEIGMQARVEFDDSGKYLRHRLDKNYRLKGLNVRLSTTILGERVN
jgi:hypothetical protein